MAQSRAAAAPHRAKSTEMVQRLVRTPPGDLPGGCASGRPIQEETLQQTKDPVDRLDLSAGWGMPQDPPEGAALSGWGTRVSGLFPQTYISRR